MGEQSQDRDPSELEPRDSRAAYRLQCLEQIAAIWPGGAASILRHKRGVVVLQGHRDGAVAYRFLLLLPVVRVRTSPQAADPTAAGRLD